MYSSLAWRVIQNVSNCVTEPFSNLTCCFQTVGHHKYTLIPERNSKDEYQNIETQIEVWYNFSTLLIGVDMAGKTVKIYLKDGLPTSLLIAEIFNWTGKVYVVPRSQIVKLADRREVKQTGIYLLVGQDLNEVTRERIYIGESENVWLRLKQHNDAADKDFWEKTIIIISKDENLTKAHVRFLESQLINLAQKARRAVVMNGTNPPAPSLPESDIDDMEYFLEQVRMLLPVLGFSFLQTLPSSEELRNTSPKALFSETSPLFWLKMSNNAFAEAREINGEFVVLKGSHAQKKAATSLLQARKILRDQLQQEGKLRIDVQENFLVFTEDVPFNSPSSAASVVTGAQTNGRTTWKVKDSTQTYKDWQEKELENVSQESASESTLD